jgi:hypothetical protein
LSHVDLKQVIALLSQYTLERKSRLEIILLGGLALQYYGMQDRATVDLDGEVKGDLSSLFQFLKAHHVPADLGENVSGWSVIAMPPGYRERAVSIHQDDLLEVKVLSPLDLIIAKLRRFTEEDIADALFIAGKCAVTAEAIQMAADEAIHHSVSDTALFLFRENVQIFLDQWSCG